MNFPRMSNCLPVCLWRVELLFSQAPAGDLRDGSCSAGSCASLVYMLLGPQRRVISSWHLTTNSAQFTFSELLGLSSHKIFSLG